MTKTEQFKKIKLLVSDFDGVMTDGYVYIDENGKETVRCSRKDGLGIELLKKNGLDCIVISKEVNPVVSVRCKKLKIECFQKISDSDGKFDILKKVTKSKNLQLDEIAYIGDDLNDMNIFGNVGVSIAVADGHKKLKDMADYITETNGGKHAIREVCEKILEDKGIDISF